MRSISVLNIILTLCYFIYDEDNYKKLNKIIQCFFNVIINTLIGLCYNVNFFGLAGHFVSK